MRGRAKVRQYMVALKKKHPEANHFYFDEERFNPSELAALAESQGLFFDKFLVALEGLLVHQEYGVVIEELAFKLAKSPNLFVIWDEVIPKARLDKLKKVAEKVETFELKKQVSKPAFNIFSVTDSIVARDRRAAWLALTQALRAGVSAEEVFWKWWWQFKIITQTATDSAGARQVLKPFVYNKALAGARKYSLAELKTHLISLTNLFHQSRFSGTELLYELEYFALTL